MSSLLSVCIWNCTTVGSGCTSYSIGPLRQISEVLAVNSTLTRLIALKDSCSLIHCYSYVGHLTTRPVASLYRVEWMDDRCMIIWKEMVVAWWIYHPGISWRSWETPRKADVLAEIRIEFVSRVLPLRHPVRFLFTVICVMLSYVGKGLAVRWSPIQTVLINLWKNELFRN
jgi:hypothetical protein